MFHNLFLEASNDVSAEVLTSCLLSYICVIKLMNLSWQGHSCCSVSEKPQRSMLPWRPRIWLFLCPHQAFINSLSFITFTPCMRPHPLWSSIQENVIILKDNVTFTFRSWEVKRLILPSTWSDVENDLWLTFDGKWTKSKHRPVADGGPLSLALFETVTATLWLADATKSSRVHLGCHLLQRSVFVFGWLLQVFTMLFTKSCWFTN